MEQLQQMCDFEPCRHCGAAKEKGFWAKTDTMSYARALSPSLDIEQSLCTIEQHTPTIPCVTIVSPKCWKVSVLSYDAHRHICAVTGEAPYASGASWYEGIVHANINRKTT